MGSVEYDLARYQAECERADEIYAALDTVECPECGADTERQNVPEEAVEAVTDAWGDMKLFSVCEECEQWAV